MSARLGGAVALGTLAVVLGWALPAAPPIAPEVAIGHARALGAAGAVVLALIGAGRVAWRLLARFDAEPVGFVHEVPAGVLVVAAIVGGGITVGAPTALVITVAVALGVLGLALPGPPAAAPRPAVLALIVAALGVTAIAALAPPTDTDELYWQLAVPAQLLRGTLADGWWNPVASRPLTWQLVSTAALALGGESAPRLVHVLVTGLVALGVLDVARAHGGRAGDTGGTIGVALLLGTWTVLDEAPLAHDNVPAALCVLAAADAALRGRALPLGVAGGAALAIKYTSAPWLAGIGLVFLSRRSGTAGERVRDAAIAAAVASLVVSPWWIRNALAGLHPLFPYAGWPSESGMLYVFREKYGAGQGLADLLLAPVRLLTLADPRSYVFLGRIHPLWVLTLPVVTWRAVSDRTVRALLGVAAVGFVGWFLGMQWVRHLVPGAPVLAVATGLAVAHHGPTVTRVWLAAWLLLLPPQALDAIGRAGHAVPVVVGELGRSEWLAAEVRGYDAYAWVDAHTPRDAHIGLFFTGAGFLLHRATVLGSVEDHTPSRLHVLRHGPAALSSLRDEGVGWVIVQRVRFLERQYPFLDTNTFDAQLLAPERDLEARLLAEGTLVFESGRFSVWALHLDEPGSRE